MDYARLGKSGLKVSRLGLGTMTFGLQTGKEDSFAILEEAWDAGITFLDCADIYPLGGGIEMAGLTESWVGEWLQGKPRDKMVLASKCLARVGTGPNDEGLSRQHIIQAAEQSLRRLHTDYLDLYMAHAYDEQTGLEETLRAFEDLVQAGKIRYFGVSNWDAWQMSKALGIQERYNYHPLISNQMRYNLLYRLPEVEITPMCLAEGVGLIAYNPLAGGMLTGKYESIHQTLGATRFNESIGGKLYAQRYWNEQIFAAAKKYADFCGKAGLNPVTTAVRWTLQQQPVSCVLLGASRPGQLKDSLAASGSVLREDAMDFLNTLWYGIPRSPQEQRH